LPARGRVCRESGVTLLELAIVLAIVGTLAAIAAPNVIRWEHDQQVKGAARDVADLLMLARAESTRTGDRYVVFFGPLGTTDPAGTVIGQPILVLDDGPPATSDCHIDAGEPTRSVQPVANVAWGVSLATTRAPGDTGAAAFTPPLAGGGTFADPTNNPVQWFLFGPNGVPLRFQGQLANCGTIGTTALGGAALYLTDGTRDYAVVLSPMGNARVFVWDRGAGAWQT